MKYKVGNKVKMREDLEWDKFFHESFQKLDPPYVVTIAQANIEDNDNKRKRNRYGIEGFRIGLPWFEHEIEGIYKEPTPIKTRFEILDL